MKNRIGKIMNVLLVLLVILNVIVILNRVKSKRENKAKYIQGESSLSQPNNFDMLCPELDLKSMNEEWIRLREFIGEVITIRFSRFNIQDLPYLHYLDHIYRKHKNEGVHLIFIKIIDKNNIRTFEDIFNSSVPIIEDDGYLGGIFQARLNDTLIFGKDFRLKLQSNQIENITIYRQILKQVNGGHIPPSLSNEELPDFISKVSFLNVRSGETEFLRDIVNTNATVINLFVSTCFGCPSNTRIELLRELSLNPDTPSPVILFGQGNSPNVINDFIKGRRISSIKVGIIIPSAELSDDDYSKMLALDINPRLFIYNRHGKLYSELPNSEIPSIDFIIDRMQ